MTHSQQTPGGASAPRGDTDKQQKKFAFFVWVLLAATTAAQVPWLASLRHLGANVWWLATVFLLANSQLYVRLRYLPTPDPPPSWWERWVIWPYFTWTVWAGWYLPFGLFDMFWGLPDAVRLYALIGTALAGLYTTGIPWRRVVVRTVDIKIDNLPADLDGLRIAQLTDIHLGPMVPERRVARWMDRVNALNVDHVVLTGDLIASGTEFIEPLERVLGRLRPRGQVFSIMGNHDYFGRAGDALIAMHERLGHVLLRNRAVCLGGNAYIAGVDDAWRRLTDLDLALKGRLPTDRVILLSHDPDLFPESADRGVALQISGHIHGGQIAIPGLGRAGSVLRVFGVPWVHGHYRLERSQLWLGAGLGTTGVPIRVGVPSEIPVLRLIRGVDADNTSP